MPAADVLDPAIADEATALLQRLIRFETVNPPGNERACVEHVAAILEEAGFRIEMDGRTPERPNLVAELRAEGDAEPGPDDPILGLLSHVDTVLASPEDWTHGPWSGHLDETGQIWGRGAIDMKSQTAAEVTAAVSLARAGWRPARGSLKVFVVSDEETGGEEGAVWLCRERPDLARCTMLLNEGGGAPLEFRGRRHHGVCVGEKGPMRFVLRTRGVAAHASTPRLGDNALVRLAPVVARLAAAEFPVDVTPAIHGLLEGLGLPADDPEAAYAALREEAPDLAAAIEPMARVTVAPTIVSASTKINVIPDRAELRVDCRVPPGLGPDETRERLEAVIGLGTPELADVEFEWLERVPGNASATESPLMDALKDWIAEHSPDAGVVPTLLPGFTDSRTWRAAFPDCVAYGFFPHHAIGLREQAGRMHAKDERIDRSDLELATACFRDVAVRVLG